MFFSRSSLINFKNKKFFFKKRRKPPKETHGLNAVGLRLYVRLR
nr:MAG TPA: hypothetical protein [Microviridae sp.]